MLSRIMWSGIFLACWFVMFLIPGTHLFAVTNFILQLAIFVPFAFVPGWRTTRLSYVDFAWPAGLVVIGLQVFYFGGLSPVAMMLGAIYTIVGLRMAVWGAHIFKQGVELPRYQYQRRRWERAGFTSERLSVQYEISVQGMANVSFLAVPAYVLVTKKSLDIGIVEITAFALWLFAWGMESLADLQKRRFVRDLQRGKLDVCDLGLWRYSRHPNYFFQWLQWVAIVVFVIPSLLALRDDVSLPLLLLVGASAFWVIPMMYSTLVEYTGAKPAEHYSVRKRPAYKEYQQTVNRFFPGPRREAGKVVIQALRE